MAAILLLLVGLAHAAEPVTSSEQIVVPLGAAAASAMAIVSAGVVLVGWLLGEARRRAVTDTKLDNLATQLAPIVQLEGTVRVQDTQITNTRERLDGHRGRMDHQDQVLILLREHTDRELGTLRVHTSELDRAITELRVREQVRQG